MSENNKAQDFVKEYGDLVKKFKMDFIHYPMFVPDSTSPGAFKIIIQSRPIEVTDTNESFIETK